MANERCELSRLTHSAVEASARGSVSIGEGERVAAHYHGGECCPTGTGEVGGNLELISATWSMQFDLRVAIRQPTDGESNLVGRRWRRWRWRRRWRRWRISAGCPAQGE